MTNKVDRYIVNLVQSHKFGPWLTSGVTAQTLREAKRLKTSTAYGAEVPSWAVTIWDTKRLEYVRT